MADADKRSAILGRARTALSHAGGGDERRATVKARLAAHKANLIPARARVSHAEQIKLFREQAEAVQTTIDEVDSADAVPDAVAKYLRSQNLPQVIRHGDDQRLTGMSWDEVIERKRGPAQASDDVSVSHAFAGVAETGTLVLLSGSDNPTTLNFLPETHVVAIQAGDITGNYEEVWQAVRAKFGDREMPRTVNMITGPSRTADIEQTIELGAHGPRRLHIVIYGSKR